jgi:ribosome-binding factor A
MPSCSSSGRTTEYPGRMPRGERTDRVGEEFREILAEEIQKLKDPRVGFVTVTGVKVSPDLRVAWVYYSAFGDDKAKAASRAALRSAAPHLRHELGRQIRLKVTPEVRFEEDASIATGERIDAIIDGIHEKDEAAGDT